MRKNTLIYPLLGLIFLLCHASNLFAMVYNGTPYSMKQPNGEEVTVLLYGTELYIDAESEDHYTLTTDEKSGEICYALLSSDGKEYASSGIVYQGGETPEAVKMLVEPSIRIAQESREEKIAHTRKTLNKEADTISSPTLRAATTLPDTVYGLCILLDFPDVKSDVSREQIYQVLNGEGAPLFGNAMSIKEYFSWISQGKLTYINLIPQKFHTTANVKTYYAPLDATDYTFETIKPEIREAINEWANESPNNLRKLTQNEYGGIKALNILYAGRCDNKWATGLWPHQSYMTLKLDGNVFSRMAEHSYQITDIDKQLTIGTFVHENGHLVCGWPDFYQYEEHEANNASKYNIGDAFSISSQTNPTYPNPWALEQMGWLTDAQDITDVKGGKTIYLEQGCGHAAVYKGTGNNANEAYYIEVRDKHYGSWNNRDKGIFIWHYNAKGNNNYPNYPELLDCKPATDANPFWSKSSGPDHFSDDSNPSAKWVDGANSGIYLWDFSNYATTMSFRCGQYVENPEFTKTGLSQAAIFTPYSDTADVSGGDAPYKFRVYSGSLPDGISLNEEGILSGTPTHAEEAAFTLEVTDAKGKKALQAYTISVISSTPYYDEPFTVPGSFQMENYDQGGNGISYSTTRRGNYPRFDGGTFPLFKFVNRTTGAELGYTTTFEENNEWIQFTINVKQSDTYNMTLRNSTNNDAVLGISLDYQKMDTMLIAGVPNVKVTSNSTGYKFTTKEIYLPEGIHKLRFETENAISMLCLDSISFTTKSLTGANNLTQEEINYQLIQNPATDHFTLLNTVGGETISVYAITGKLMDIFQGENGTTAFGADYPAGLYLITISTEDGFATLKAIKRE